MDPSDSPTPLWSSTAAGGCARKLSATLAAELAAATTAPSEFMEDAAAVVLRGQQSLLSIDFITPVVPDPTDYGRIAAANALSDIFVVGGRPLFAVAVACVPQGTAFGQYRDALLAAQKHLKAYGCELVGGHSIWDQEAKLGFAVVGEPNGTGRLLGVGAVPGDALLLTKPLGSGVLTTATRRGMMTSADLADAVAVMIKPNEFVPVLIESLEGDALHAATDITGFGLLGHSYELCRRSRVGAAICLDRLPAFERARELASAGVHTSALAGNTDYVSGFCSFDVDRLELADRVLLMDAQTSGGALLSVDAAKAQAIMDQLAGKDVAAVLVGHVTSDPCITLV